MKIEHLAIWTENLEKMKDFYIKYFDMKCGLIYRNPSKNYSSYFLTFKGESTRIELMHRTDIAPNTENKGMNTGLAHFSISVGNKEMVDELTTKLGEDGYRIVGLPRTTGDGYYESVIEDCEGNLVELTE
jgi:Lactoylglutathione lyase and related lyases